MRRLILSALVFMTPHGFAADAPLRFSISDSWSMPLVNIQNNQPDDGMLFDIMQSLARQVGRPVEYHVLPRLRVQSALERGEINIRCYASQAWVPNMSGDYTWSLPLLTQRDLLVGVPDASTTTSSIEMLTNENVGTVLGYHYSVLQPLFDSGQLIREDARSQTLVLEKLAVGRYRYAISSQLALDWFNRERPAQQRLRSLTTISEQPAGCIVRNDPDIPVQHILRVLVRMKVSGELQRIIDKYLPQPEVPDPSIMFGP